MWKSLIYSFVTSLLLVLLARGFFGEMGLLVTRPGLVLETAITGIILLLLPTGDHYVRLPEGTDIVLSIAIYAAALFGTVMLFRATIKRER